MRILAGSVTSLTVVCIQVQVKNMMKSWSDLYVNFVRLSSMVANTEPNIASEELSSSIVNVIDQLTADVCLPVFDPLPSNKWWAQVRFWVSVIIVPDLLVDVAIDRISSQSGEIVMIII